jgi:AraC-like DNA-binding protein
VVAADPTEPLNRFRRMRTHDVAEAEHIVSDTYVPHSLSADAELDARLNVADGRRITFGYLAYGAETELAVPPMVDFIHLNLTLRGRTAVCQGRASAETVALHEGVVLSPVEHSTLRWSADAAQFAIKIPVRTLEDHLSALLHEAVLELPRFALSVDLSAPAGMGLLLAANFLAEQANSLYPPSNLVCEQLESYLLTQVLLSVENTYSPQLAAPAGPIGRFQLEEAVEYIEAHPERPLDVAELAAVTATPASALRTAFEEELGVTPERFVSGVRLRRAHAELRSGDPSHGSLTAIARRWGFAHLDRFVSDYSAQYGEHPSRVLRRARNSTRTARA